MSEPGGELITFPCRTGGFDPPSGNSLLDQFDGSDRRDVTLYAGRDNQEQPLVSLHELLSSMAILCETKTPGW